MSKNFNLTLHEYETLVNSLRHGDEQLFEKIFLQHFKVVVHQLQAKYRCSQSEAYDATMDAILELRLKIIDGKIKYGNLDYLFFLMASQVLMRNLKKFRLSDFDENLLNHEDSMFSDEDIDNLNKAWSDLSKECQGLLSRNVFSGIKLKDIAHEDGRTHLAVRKHKKRCLDKLLMFFKKYSVPNLQ